MNEDLFFLKTLLLVSGFKSVDKEIQNLPVNSSKEALYIETT